MTPHQARLLCAILHRLASNETVSREQIDDFAEALGAYSDLSGNSSVSAGSPEVGTPMLTVHNDQKAD